MIRKLATLLASAVCLTMASGCAERSSAPAGEGATSNADATAPAVDAPTSVADATDELPGVALAVRATGNEPAWRIDMSSTAVVLTTLDGETRAGAPTIDSTYVDGAVLYAASGEKGDIAVKLIDQLCVDSMSGMPHPLTVQVWADGRELSGCGGDPASLLHGPEWIVDDIGGTPLLKDSSVTLTFGEDGMLSGGSSCNRFMAGYSLSGEGLTIQQGAGGMMMCEDPLMEQESRFLALLVTARQFEITPQGELLLKASDGLTIRAKRQDVLDGEGARH